MVTDDTKTSSKKNTTKADLEAKIAALEAQLAAKEVACATDGSVASVEPNVTFSVPSTDVTIVYCSDSLGFAHISNMDLNFNRYGEEFILSRSQFDEFVGKYRSWFDRGVLAVSYDNLKVAIAKGLRTDKEIGLDYAKLSSLGVMSVADLEKLWDSLSLDSQKESVVSYFKRKFIEGDVNFKVREKIDLLNRLTKGGFKREQDELNGRYKITPVDM